MWISLHKKIHLVGIWNVLALKAVTCARYLSMNSWLPPVPNIAGKSN